MASCACGCGEEAGPGKKFVLGHNTRVEEISPRCPSCGASRPGWSRASREGALCGTCEAMHELRLEVEALARQVKRLGNLLGGRAPDPLAAEDLGDGVTLAEHATQEGELIEIRRESLRWLFRRSEAGLERIPTEAGVRHGA